MDTETRPLNDSGMLEIEMNLSEIIRNQFFKLDTDEPLAHVYVRPVYTDHKMDKKVISFVGCMRKDSALNNFPNEQVMVVENGSCKQGAKVPYGNNLSQVLNLDEMALSDGVKAYSGNATDYDDKKRSFYKELLALGLESSKDERIEVYAKHFPNEILVSSYIYDNEYLTYLKFMMNEGMEPKEAYKAALLEIEE